ncbi:hypothetical protein QQF64_024130 [Cirrhinus molitorella]|uniref:Uncharacterized protein n=1 Tax=Cirrhinus molitorella TaxID=172907 RepID=A0ABR3NKD0_9TELE
MHEKRQEDIKWMFARNRGPARTNDLIPSTSVAREETGAVDLSSGGDTSTDGESSVTEDSCDDSSDSSSSSSEETPQRRKTKKHKTKKKTKQKRTRRKARSKNMTR